MQCDRCGMIYMSSEIVYDGYDKGLRVCIYGCNDPPHPADHTRAIEDDPSVDDARPMNWVQRS